MQLPLIKHPLLFEPLNKEWNCLGAAPPSANDYLYCPAGSLRANSQLLYELSKVLCSAPLDIKSRMELPRTVTPPAVVAVVVTPIYGVGELGTNIPLVLSS